MTDAFLNQLGVDWRSQAAPTEARRRLRRQRLVSSLLFGLEVGAAAVGVAAGGWLLWAGLGPYSVLARMAGAVLVTAPPLFACVAWTVRRSQPALEAVTAEELLAYSMRRLRTIDRLVSLGAWHAYVLLAFAVAIAASVAAGWSPRDWIMGAYCAFYLATAAAVLGWVRWRRRRIARETEACRAILEDFRGSAD